MIIDELSINNTNVLLSVIENQFNSLLIYCPNIHLHLMEKIIKNDTANSGVLKKLCGLITMRFMYDYNWIIVS